MSWSPTANAVNNHLGCLISIQLTFGKNPMETVFHRFDRLIE